MRILGIETSCDETSAAVVDNGSQVQSCIIASSQQTFERSGGVIPEEAARKQVESVNAVIAQALEDATCTWSEIDAIAVTKGPGLLVSLLVGTTVARTLASLHKKPLIGVHHTLGHLVSTALGREETPFPILTLSASGGHTDLWYRTSLLQGQLLGRTLDDAAGEAFDKGASMLGLPYPGGPSISREAEGGDPYAFEFPLPLKDKPGLQFSYSGLKTALRHLIQEQGTETLSSTLKADLAASYQHALCAHLVDRLKRAEKKHLDVQEIHIVGGVSANTYLRSLIQKECTAKLIAPTEFVYCTDNAAMIAAAGEYLFQEMGDAAYDNFETNASIRLEECLV